MPTLPRVNDCHGQQSTVQMTAPLPCNEISLKPPKLTWYISHAAVRSKKAVSVKVAG